MNSIVVANNRYNLIKTSEINGEKALHWVWGKTDFITIIKKNSDQNAAGSVFLVKKEHLLPPVEVSGHGIMFDEVKFSDGVHEIYLELPKGFLGDLADINKQLISLSS